MNIIVNGIGCNLSGGKLVLNSFLKSYPFKNKSFAYIPSSINASSTKKALKVFYLSHKVFGQLFRPFFDFYISIYASFFGSGVVLNLSNYGLPFFNEEIVYVHNPLLVSEKYYESSTGFAIKYKRFAFLLTLKRARVIIVQTEHMKKTLQSFMMSNEIESSMRLFVFKPYHEIPKVQKSVISENSRVRFFYPASSFPHKRVDLAIKGILSAGTFSELSITADQSSYKQCDRLNFLGKIEFDEVIKQFNDCDALLFTSEKETLGLPLLEALSLSKPAVLPNLPYAVEIYGDAGVYFDSFEPSEVAKAIDYLVSNLDEYKERVALRKEAEFSTRITWEEQWQKIHEILTDEKNRS